MNPAQVSRGSSFSSHSSACLVNMDLSCSCSCSPQEPFPFGPKVKSAWLYAAGGSRGETKDFPFLPPGLIQEKKGRRNCWVTFQQKYMQKSHLLSGLRNWNLARPARGSYFNQIGNVRARSRSGGKPQEMRAWHAIRLFFTPARSPLLELPQRAIAGNLVTKQGLMIFLP